MATKVKTVETYNSHTVCKGKLVFVMCYPDSKDIWGKSKTLSIIGDDGKYKGRRVFPIIISETERPVPTENERVYSTVSKTISTFPDPRFFSDGTYFKVLAFPENFSQEQLKMIVDGKLKDGDDVLVECEYKSPGALTGTVTGNYIKLTDNHITLITDNIELPENYKEITGWNNPDELSAYETGRKHEEMVTLDFIKKWNGSANSHFGQLLLDKYKELFQDNESWDNIIEQYGLAETTQKFERWLELNYNPPTKKNK